MKLVVRFRWLILAIWILAATLLAWKAPGMEKLVREKGQVTVPEGYPSTLASEIKKHHTNDKEGSESFILNQNPYSNHAMKTIDNINDSLKTSLKGTKLENVHVGISGVTSMIHNLRCQMQITVERYY